jgi:pyruvate dehydrogenase (quinone)
MSGPTVAEALVDKLASVGVDHVYGIAGDSLNAITNVIRTRKDFRWVPVRHEEAAGFACAAEAHLTRRLAVCAGSCGPGNLHLINGLYDAHRSRVPVLAIAAQIQSSEIGSEYFQETHPERIFRECSHYAEVIAEPEQAPRVLDTAIRMAVSRRGVSVVVLPGDVAWRAAPAPERADRPPAAEAMLVPSEDALAQMAGLLNGARRITILAGAGCVEAHDEVVALAGKLKSPIVHTMRGKEFLEYANPCDVGMTGLLGFSSGYHAMMDSDVLLMLGTDFPYRPFYPTDATIIQVDVRGEQIGRRVPVDLGVIGDVRATVTAVLPRIQAHPDDQHLTASLGHYAKAREGLDDLATGTPGESPVHPQYVTKILDQLAAPDAIFTCDVGEPTVWAARYLRFNGTRRIVGSFVHGSMAGAMPHAIGAQVSHPGRQVISLSGDGGLAMLLGELLTIAQLKLPIKIVVFDNHALGFVELEMKAAGLLPFAIDLANPDFAAVATAIGFLGLRVETADQVQPALEQALAHPGPALIDVVTSHQEIIMPPSIKWDEFSGFSLYMIKAVLNGRGDEVIDLAKTALFR